MNQTWFVLDTGWWDAKDDAMAHEATKAIQERIKGAAEEEQKGLEFLFMNDASWDQDVIGGYGAQNVRRLREVARRYDPQRVFQRLVKGGFKLPREG